MTKRFMVCALLAACGGGAKPATTQPAKPAVADDGKFTPPGPCVDPAADFTARFKGTISPEAGVDVNEIDDLDGDGIADVSASTGLGFMVANSIYIKRGKCGHFVGEVGAELQSVMDDQHSHGLPNLTINDAGAACEGTRCGCTQGYLVFKFDGTEYKEDTAASQPSVEKTCDDADGEGD